MLKLVKKHSNNDTDTLMTTDKQHPLRALMLGLFISLFVAGYAQAKDVYISDKLRVGVRPKPGQRYAPVNVVVTGMKLKVLDSKDGFLKIRSESGIEGWIKAIYVVDKPPAELQLKVLQKQFDKLRQELDKSEETIKALNKAQTVLNEHIDRLKAERAELQRDQAVLIASDPDRGLWWVVVFAAGVLGIVAGYLAHRFYTMRRLGGLRI